MLLNTFYYDVIPLSEKKSKWYIYILFSASTSGITPVLSTQKSKGRTAVTSWKGKGKMRKRTPPPQDTEVEELSQKQKQSLCIICKRKTPVNFLKYNLEILDWGQCDWCDGWVHLRFCTEVTQLSPRDPFICPQCASIEE